MKALPHQVTIHGGECSGLSSPAGPYDGAVAINQPPSQIVGRIFLSVTIVNQSPSPWRSSDSDPVHLSYHWMEAKGETIVFEGKRSRLPGPGVMPGESCSCTMLIDPPLDEGRYLLMVTMVREGITWFENHHGFRPAKIEMDVVSSKNSKDALSVMVVDDRARMTLSCRDADPIPKVADAGSVKDCRGRKVQVMHEGSVMIAGGYCGDWMISVINGLKGHHEPQEEWIFHHLLKHVRPGSLMVEIGSFWAYYTNWYLGSVQGSRAICIEPDENNMAVGIENLALNDRSAIMINASVGEISIEEAEIRRESDGLNVKVPQWDFRRIVDESSGKLVELLHIDAQGAELPFIRGMRREGCVGKVRFLVISTHHHSISGSRTTHHDCLIELMGMGAVILAEHSVEESFSGDGLIVASLDAQDAHLVLPEISKNHPQNSLFGEDLRRIRVQARYGPMMIAEGDCVIGESLAINGSFEEAKIGEVVEFLKNRSGFSPGLFIDIGANIGTHLVSSLVEWGFKQGVGCEPDPLNFDLLKENIALNGVNARARLFNVALSDSSTVSTLELSPSNFGDHRIRKRGSERPRYPEEHPRETCSVMVEKGASLFRGHGVECNRNTLVWIDTQGHEGYVLSGLWDWIEPQNAPALVIEFWPEGIESSGGRSSVFEFLRNCACIYDINSLDWQKLRGVSHEELELMYGNMLSETSESKSPHTDLLLLLKPLRHP